MINAHCLKNQVIEPTLNYLNDLNMSTVDLLLGTAAIESNLSPLNELDSDTKGFGLFNISAQSHTDIWDKYLAFDPDLASKIRGLASQRSFLINPHIELSTNLAYATAIAWCIYKHSSVSIKAKESIKNLSLLWNTYYRQSGSKYTSRDFCLRYDDLISGNEMATLEEQTVSAA